jgi:hypothetical protein
VRLVQIIVTGKLRQQSSTDPFFRLGASAIASILSILPHPESIMVSSPRCALRWRTLDPEFCRAFRNSVQLPSIKHVAIYNVHGISLDHFEECKNLRNLFLNGRVSTHGGDISSSLYPRLWSLEIDTQLDLTSLASWMKSITLHTLSLHIHSRCSLSDFRPLIEACSTTLVNLNINNVYCGEL